MTGVRLNVSFALLGSRDRMIVKANAEEVTARVFWWTRSTTVKARDENRRCSVRSALTDFVEKCAADGMSDRDMTG